MSGMQTANWIEHNQERLGAAIATLLARLEGLTALDEQPDIATDLDLDLDVPSLAAVARRFDLSTFEQALLLLTAAVEFNGAFAPLCAAANGDGRRPWATFGLALAAIPEGHWSALSPEAPLRRYRLVHVDPAEHLTCARLRIDERVLHLLVGVEAPDQRLAPFVGERIASLHPLPRSQAALVTAIASAWAARGARTVAQLCGSDRDQRRAVVDGIARACGSGRVLEVDATVLPPAGPELEDLMGRLARESVLNGALIAWHDSAGVGDGRQWPLAHLCSFDGVLLVAESAGRTAVDLRIVVHDVPTPSTCEQRHMWERVLPSASLGVSDRLAKGFVLTSEVADSIVGSLGDTPTGQQLWDACRRRLRSDVGGSAEVREPKAGWEQLVLPAESRALLEALEVEARFKAQVHEQWGLDGSGRRARGTSALFCGPSGTGKTLAAEVIATSLGVDLLHIDLSQVVNKYIGETEKNLARAFDAGERSGAVLLFDEADALFGKRTEIKDSHDRYANIEVSYLLQRMEGYSGVAVLTTNMRANLDPAFVRRLRFIVTFPHPAFAQRAEIWKRVFPPAVDVSDLDADLLARLDVAGGAIANIAMAAALRAASENATINMRHVRAAAELEYMKLERPLTDSELVGWA